MTRSRRILIVVAFIFSFSLVASEKLNSSSRRYDESEMSRYDSSDDFGYMKLTVQPPSIWQRLQWWIGAMIAKIFSNPNAPWLSKILFYALLHLVVGFAIFYMVRLKYGGALSSRSRFNISGDASTELPSEKIDFDQLIESAVDEKNFKLAIRYLYLKTLTYLSIRDVIKLRNWKSPYDYEKEMDEHIVLPYKSLARLFEYVWYGDVKVGSEEFVKGKELIATIEDRLK
ncbi:MAG: hypothetical protein ABJG78_12920 [Cyclobacteriaceae bacterium]